jgi:tetratricopeptide (TPR) repeat protein
MLLLPFILLATLELGLRLVGFGGNHPLFIESVTVPGALEANPKVADRYMATAGAPFSKIEPIPFRRSKSPDAYRIVVQGGSSAAGYPYGRWGGLAGMLGDRLEATFPGHEVEVVTTAMSAVNSYTLADLAEEIVAIEPDAVLVYAGHNEYIGVLGVGSALTSSSSQTMARLRLRLRHLRLYQLIEWGVVQGKVIARLLARDRSSFFAKVASGSQIAYGSEAYRAGIKQFETNLESLLARYARAGIRVYIGTLVSNEKDLAPLAGDPGEKVDRIAWNTLMEQQHKLREAGDLAAARGAVKGLLELDPDAADAWFALGQLEYAADRSFEAREAFLRARDFDRLRFRAPGAFEALIRRLAARHGATVVEVEDRFRERVPEGLIGREIMLEHVHPNGEGYFLLADAFYEALRHDAVIGDWGSAPSRDEALTDMPLTEIDQLLGYYTVQELIAGPPFTDSPRPFMLPAPRNEVERLAQQLRAGEIEWLEAMETLLKLRREQGRTADAARISRLIAQALPAEHTPNLTAGLLLMKLGRHARARRYLERALQASPNDVSTWAALVEADLALGDKESVAKRLIHLRELAPEHPLVLRRAASETP